MSKFILRIAQIAALTALIASCATDPTEYGGEAWAGTTTTNLGLYKPSVGETGWADEINNNTDVLDASVGTYINTDGTFKGTLISDLTEITAVNADYLWIWDATDSAIKKIPWSQVTSGATGDSISIDSVAVTDPDFVSTGDIDFVDTSNTVTANINAGAVQDAEIDYTAVTLNDLTFDVGSVSKTEYGYLNGVTSALQTQLDAKQGLDADLTTLAGATAWRLFYSNGTSVITELAFGTSGQYLKSQGASSAPTWDTPAGGSGSMTTAKESNVQVGGADIVVLDFGAGFDLSESPDTEINIVLDFTEVAGHDNFTDFVANEHIDWTGASAGTIHATNYVDNDTQLDLSGVETITGNWVNTTNPWADNEVADDITASSYLPLAGGTLTGELVVDNLGLEFAPGDDHSDCSAFAATGGGIFYDDSEGKFKKCQDNNLTDLDTTGGTPSFATLTGGTNTSAAMVVGTGASLATSGSGTIDATTGDSATGFFDAGSIEINYGGTGGDFSSITTAQFLVASGVGTLAAVSMTGDATLAANGALSIGSDKITEAMMKAVNAAVDEDIVTYESTTGDFEYHTPSELITAGNYISWTSTTLNVAAADLTTVGAVELATAAETTTGTDATRAVTPDGLAGSDYGKRVAYLVVLDDTTDTAVKDGSGDFEYTIPSVMAGYNLVDIECGVFVAGTNSTTDIQIHNVTDTTDMLSTKCTIDATELNSHTAATAPVINGSNDDVTTADRIRVDVDSIASGTAAKGLWVELTFQEP